MTEIAVAALPPFTCDTHTHVFGPAERFPVRAATSYVPPDSPFERHATAMRTHGIERAVLIQPVPYQTDNSAIVDAIARSRGGLRGIAVLTGDASPGLIDELHDRGIRGLRFNEMLDPSGQGRYRGAIGVEHLSSLAPCMRERNMHAQIWAAAHTCVALAGLLRPFGLPLVFDHMGGIDISKGTRDPSFQGLLRLLADGQIWIKLTVCRVSQGPPNDYSDVLPFHEALVRENPERLLWGSDFPFVRMAGCTPELQRLVELFLQWTPTVAQQQILVDNPARLFGFSNGQRIDPL